MDILSPTPQAYKESEKGCLELPSAAKKPLTYRAYAEHTVPPIKANI
jgi:hypothetical protein